MNEACTSRGLFDYKATSNKLAPGQDFEGTGRVICRVHNHSRDNVWPSFLEAEKVEALAQSSCCCWMNDCS